MRAANTNLRDRTSEFAAVVERMRKQQGISSVSPGQISDPASASSFRQDPASSSHASQSEFSRRAADIGHGIHRTSLKLAKLAQLAKRTSMFDDPANEVDELTGMIKQDIQAMNASIAELQRISLQQQRGAGSGGKQSADHTHTVVDSLRSRLKDATAEFKDVLTSRTDNLKHHQDRRGLFSVAGTDAESNMPLLPPMSHQQQSLTQRHGLGSGGLSQGNVSGPSFHSEGAPIQPPSFMQQAGQQQQLQLSQPQDTYLSSRAEALRNVESTIVELGTIFNKLGEMVAQQGELAIRIDENVEDTLSNVNSAQAQLMKYLNTVSSNRMLLLKVFGVLMAFLVLFVVFVV